MRSWQIILFTILAQLFNSAVMEAGIGRWTQMGPSLPANITCLVQSKLNPQVFYAGTEYGGLYKTSNGGQTWRYLAFVGGRIRDIAIINNNGKEALFTSAYDGLEVYRSDDQGENWRLIKERSDYFYCRRIVVDPTDDDIIYVGMDNGVVKTINGGLDWFTVDYGFLAGDLTIHFLQIHPDSTNVIYAATYYRLYRSQDGARSWNLIGDFKEKLIHCITIDYNNPGRIYVGTHYGIFRTENYGKDWFETKILGGDTRQIIVHPQNTSKIYVVTWDGLHLFTADGILLRRDILNQRFMHLLIDYTNPDHFYVSTEANGIFFSPDAGENWYDINNGFHTYNVYAIGIHPQKPQRILVVDQQFRVSLSNDSGITWEIRDLGLQFLGFSPRAVHSFLYLLWADDNPNVFYFFYSTYNLFLKTEDGGGTWINLSERLPGPKGSGRYLAISPGNSNYLYSLVSIYEWLEEAGKTKTDYFLYISRDGGLHWKLINSELPQDVSIYSLIVDPLRPERLYAISEKGILKSPDSGIHWFQTGMEFDRISRRKMVVISPLASNTIYYTSRENLYKSTDFGSSWQEISIDDALFQEVLLSRRSNKVIFAKVWKEYSEEIYLSRDGGLNWQRIAEGLPRTILYSIAFDDSTCTLYAGVRHRGLFSYQLTKDEWQFIATDLEIPTRSVLHQSFPNPFYDMVLIRYNLRSQTRVKLEVFNLLGQRVALLVNDVQKAGWYEIPFHSSNLSSGLYFYRISMPGYSAVGKMILMR